MVEDGKEEVAREGVLMLLIVEVALEVESAT